MRFVQETFSNFIKGCRQAVRHQTLTLVSVGSNPAIPAKKGAPTRVPLFWQGWPSKERCYLRRFRFQQKQKIRLVIKANRGIFCETVAVWRVSSFFKKTSCFSYVFMLKYTKNTIHIVF